MPEKLSVAQTAPVKGVEFVAPAVLGDDKSASDFVNADEATFKAALGIKTTEEVEAPASAEPAQPEPLAALAAVSEQVKPEPQPAEAEPEKPAEPAKPPLTKFALFDKEGELEVPELFFNFKANGKEYEKVPLEKVVLLAQMGVTNQEREAQVLAGKRFVAEAQQRDADKQSAIDAYDEYFRRVFEEPEFFEAARDEYTKQNSPEQRAARAEQQLQQERGRQAVQVADATRAQFVQTALVPKVMGLLESYPDVSQEEVMGRYTMLTAPLLVRGAVPLEQLSLVQHLVENDLANWVKETHAVRELDKQRVVVDRQKLTQAAQSQAQLAKSKLARATAPASISAVPSNAPVKKSYETADEWLNTILPTPGA